MIRLWWEGDMHWSVIDGSYSAVYFSWIFFRSHSYIFLFGLSLGPSCLCTCLEREENVDSCSVK